MSENELELWNVNCHGNQDIALTSNLVPDAPVWTEGDNDHSSVDKTVLTVIQQNQTQQRQLLSLM